MNRLYTTDTKALNHVLMNDYLYQKPEGARYSLSRILGSGVLVVEGDKHKQQVNFLTILCSRQFLKRLLASNYGMVFNLSTRSSIVEQSLCHQNPAFGTAQIRELTEIFVDKSLEVVL